jgi:hypothetical protein
MRALILIALVTAFAPLRAAVRFEAAAESLFVSRAQGYTLALDRGGARLRAGKSDLYLAFVGADPRVRMRGLEELPGKSNYFAGNNRARWRMGVPNFARVRYEALYPGIDLIFYGNRGSLEFDFLVSPGADPGRIEFQLDGPFAIDAAGDLHWGPVTLRRPVVYQDCGAGSGRFARVRGDRVAFAIGAYDHTRPLVIDPVVDYATYFGGSGGSSGESIAVDRDGNIYVTGTTTSNNLPLADPMQPFFYGSNEVFVAKFDPTGSTLLYSTYLGSWGDDRALGIAVDAAGNAYVTGFTTSPDFPLVNPMQNGYNGGSLANGGDAFVFKLNPGGSELIYSTFIGGAADDFGRSIAVDEEGNAYVAGSTVSADFPVTHAIQAEHAGLRDAFVLKLNATGSALIYSSFLGGSGTDEGNSIALDAGGNVYVTGTTTSVTNFPLVNALQRTYRGGARDAFIAKINAEGSALEFCTLLGGTGDDTARSIAVDGAGAVYITGYTTSGTYPTKNALQATFRGGRDIFVSKLKPDGSELIYSTLIGGESTDEGFAIAVDAENRAHVAGFSQSLTFPMADPVQTQVGGNCTRSPCTADLVAAIIAADGSALVFSTYLGGRGADQPRALALDRAGGVYVTGNTASTDFPTRAAFQGQNTGGGAAVAFVVRIR